MAAERISPLSWKSPHWPEGEEALVKWASDVMDIKEVVLKEEHLRLTAEARVETACCAEHALASQLSEMKAAAQSSLARAASLKDEALQQLSRTEKRRHEEVRGLLEAEASLRRHMQEAEVTSDASLAELRTQHSQAERRVAREFEEYDAALMMRSKAAEELLAAAEKEMSLTRMCALHGLRGEALEARLDVSRKLMVEACQAHEAADRREVVAALARSEARGAEELAVQQAASQGLVESQLLRQGAAERAEQLAAEEASVKARADAAVDSAERETKALRDGAMQRCATSEHQAEDFIKKALEGLARKASALESAEAEAATAWETEQANISVLWDAQNLEVQEALEGAAAAAATGEELARELGEELREKLKVIRAEEKHVQYECEKAVEAVQSKGNCQEQEDMHRLRSAECSESELLAERLHVEEEVLSYEVTEEEAASMLRDRLQLHISEAAERCKELTDSTSAALQQLNDLTQLAEQKAQEVQEAAEEDEEMQRQAIHQHKASAEAAEKLQHLRCRVLQEEVLAAKLQAEQRMARDECLASEEEQAAAAEADEYKRAIWEEIAADELQAEQLLSPLIAEDLALELRAQELSDKAAELKAESSVLEMSRYKEEEVSQQLHNAVDEVRAAVQAAVHGCEARKAQAHESSLELQVAAEQKQEARSLAAAGRLSGAEFRVEAAARRSLEAEESSCIARLQYEQEISEMRQHGEKEEAETLRRVLAAEEALANSMRWSGQNHQLGLELFGVIQTSPASSGADGGQEAG